MSVRLDDITVSLSNTPILDRVTAELQPATLTCILGANGAGKTTLLKVVTGELKASSGTISVDKNPGSGGWFRRSASCFSVIPQGATAPDYLTVRELVSLGRFNPGSKPWDGLSHMDELVVQESINAAGMSQLADRKLSTLSGGELQRSWIAFCLVQRKPYMLLDESLSAIDYAARWSYFDLLSSLCRAGKGVVLVTHDLFLVEEFADVVLWMSGGRITYSGPPGKGLESAIEGNLVHSPFS